MSTRPGGFGLRQAGPEYKQADEQIMRRQVEQEVNRISESLSSQRKMRDSDSSLTLRRFQFLLMGAPNG